MQRAANRWGTVLAAKVCTFTKRFSEPKRCQQPVNATRQASRRFSLVLFCLWHNVHKMREKKLKNLQFCSKPSEREPFWVHLKHPSLYGERGDKTNLKWSLSQTKFLICHVSGALLGGCSHDP